MIFSAKRDDKGYTLVELVAVIAILVVMTGVVTMSLSIIYNEDAKRAVSLIDDELTEARMLSMSKSGTIVLIVDTDGDPSKNKLTIMRDSSVYKEVKIDKDVLISSKVNGTALTSPGTDIRIQFDKSTGSVEKVNDADAAVNGIYEITAVAQKGSRPQARLSLISNTGRHYIEKD
jgi:prepilin-type N-terminal cleavage/methylation domain-containing protein